MSLHPVVRERHVAVLPWVEADRAVEPHRPVAAVLEQQLVVVHMLQYPAVVGAARVEVGYTDVDGLARQVLGVAHAVYALVDHGRAEGTVDADDAELSAQRLQEHAAEVLEGCYLQAVGGIVTVVSVGPCRAGHLVVAEVFCQLEILSFHRCFLFGLTLLIYCRPSRLDSAKLATKNNRPPSFAARVAKVGAPCSKPRPARASVGVQGRTGGKI